MKLKSIIILILILHPNPVYTGKSRKSTFSTLQDTLRFEKTAISSEADLYKKCNFSNKKCMPSSGCSPLDNFTCQICPIKMGYYDKNRPPHGSEPGHNYPIHSKYCNFSEDCCPDEICVKLVQFGSCNPCTHELSDKNFCNFDFECCTQRCVDGKCAGCKSPGQSCSNNEECCFLNCQGGKCIYDSKIRTCVNRYMSCRKTSDCCKGLECKGGECKPPCIPMYDKCQSSEECCVGLICSKKSSKCIKSSCSSERENCNSDEIEGSGSPKCCSNGNLRCVNGVCSNCSVPGNTCFSKNHCCGGLECINGRCNEAPKCIQLNKPCDSRGLKCCKGSCVPNEMSILTCLLKSVCISDGYNCDSDFRGKVGNYFCCKNSICYNSKCRSCDNIGDKCNSIDDCCPGLLCSSKRKCEKPPTCLNPNEECKDQKLKCCSGGCYPDSDGLVYTCQDKPPKCMNINAPCDDSILFCCLSKFLMCYNGKCRNCKEIGIFCKSSSDCCGGNECENSKCQKPKTCLEDKEPCPDTSGKNLPCCNGGCFPNSKGTDKRCRVTPECLDNGVDCEGDENNPKTLNCCPNKNLLCFNFKCRKCNIENIPCSTSDDCCNGLICEKNQCLKPKTCLNIGEACQGKKLKCCKGGCYSNSLGEDFRCRDDKPCIVTNGLCDGDIQGMKTLNCCDDNLLCYLGTCRKCDLEGIKCSKTEECCGNLECRGGKCLKPKTCLEQGEDCINIEMKCCVGGCYPDSSGKSFRCRKEQVCLNDGANCKGDELFPADISNCCPKKQLLCFKGFCRKCNEPNIECDNDNNCCGGLKCDNGICKKPITCLEPNLPCNKDTGLPCCGNFKCYPDQTGNNYSCKSEPECMIEEAPCDGDEVMKNLFNCCSGKFLRCISSYCRRCDKIGLTCNNENECCGGLVCNEKRICDKPKVCLEEHEPCKGKNIVLPCCSEFKCFPDANGINYTCKRDPVCMNENISCDGDKKNPSGNLDCCSEPLEFRCFMGKCRRCNKDGIECLKEDDCCGNLQCKDLPKIGKHCRDCSENSPCNSNLPCCPGLDFVCLDSKCQKCRAEKEGCVDKSNCCKNLDCLKSKNGLYLCLSGPDCSSISGPCEESSDCCSGNDLSCFENICQKCSLEGDKCSPNLPCCDSKNYDCKETKSGSICVKKPDCDVMGTECTKESCCPPIKCLPDNLTPTKRLCRNEPLCVDETMSGCEEWEKLGVKCCNKIPYCLEGKCQSCVPNDGKCNSEKDCCSKICHSLQCKDCIPKGDPCQKEDPFNRNCCTGLFCINRKCQKCTDNNHKCSKDEECCSGNCFYDKEGGFSACRESHINCIDQNKSCGNAILPNLKERSCCNDIKCIDGKCLDCLPENIECADSEKDCCPSLKCSYNSKGKKICKRGENECVDKDNGECELEEKFPKCCRGFKCSGKRCKHCKRTGEKACTNDDDCCEGKCRIDKMGIEMVCKHSGEEDCIIIDGTCKENEDCCDKPDAICYHDKTKLTKTCRSCIADDVECTEGDDQSCCIGKCSQQSDGKFKCSNKTHCISVEGVPCLIDKPNHCCSPIICDKYTRTCRKCVNDSSACEKNEDCCSSNCYYNSMGSTRLCRGREDNCIKKGGQCHDEKEGDPKKECCPGLTCYEKEKRCKSNCAQDDIPCESDNDCCSNMCVFKSDGSKICGNSNQCISSIGSRCNLDKAPECCIELKCIEGKCLKCNLFPDECRSNDDCCYRNCYWDDLGLKLICRKDNVHCLPVDASCVHAKGDAESPKKECCEPNKCINDRCKRCTVTKGNPCKEDSQCCEGKCLKNHKGILICQDDVSCIDNDVTKCVLDLQFDPLNKEHQKCCADFNCYHHKCMKCSLDKCNFDDECCSRLCAWDSDGLELLCRESSNEDCIRELGRCDEIVEDPKRKLRTCCEGFCHKGLCIRCKRLLDQCKGHSDCCDGYCHNGKCTVRPKCMRDGESCAEIHCCQGYCNKDTKRCQSCKGKNSQCYRHKECCSQHCHYHKSLGYKMCSDDGSEDLPDNGPLRCRYFKEQCDLNELRCCQGYFCSDQLKICLFDGEEQCSSIREPCEKTENCCPKLKCMENKTCQPQIAPIDCKNVKETCSLDTDCCEKRCKNGICEPCDPGSVKPKHHFFPEITCSHYKEECDEKSFKCCSGLTCVKADDDIIGECLIPKKTIGCQDEGLECHLNLCCCEQLECVDGKCKKKPDLGNCVNEDEICGEELECCPPLNCLVDSYGVKTRCTMRSKAPCIRETGFCDNLERVCCTGPCIRNVCKGRCQEINNACCNNEDCCDDLICVDDVCTNKECYDLGEKCNPEKGMPCCENMVCDPVNKMCIPKPCETVPETYDNIKEILTDENGKMMTKQGKKLIQETTMILKSNERSLSNDEKKKKMRVLRLSKAKSEATKSLTNVTKTQVSVCRAKGDWCSEKKDCCEGMNCIQDESSSKTCQNNEQPLNSRNSKKTFLNLKNEINSKAGNENKDSGIKGQLKGIFKK